MIIFSLFTNNVLAPSATVMIFDIMFVHAFNMMVMMHVTYLLSTVSKWIRYSAMQCN